MSTRPRKYEENESLDRAIGVFHRFGYRGTTLAALLQATGMGRGSLYYRFQDKHEFFMAALEHYRRTVVKPHLDQLEAGLSPMDGIIELFDRAASSEGNGSDHFGSLITNAAVELAPHDARVRAFATAHFADVEAALKRAVERAQELGELSRQKDAIQIAHGLLGALQGQLVLAPGPARRDTAAGRRLRWCFTETRRRLVLEFYQNLYERPPKIGLMREMLSDRLKFYPSQSDPHRPLIRFGQGL